MHKKKIIPFFLALFVSLVLIGYGFSEWIFIGEIQDQYSTISGKLSMAEVVPNDFKISMDSSKYTLTVDQNDKGETYALNNGKINFAFSPSIGFEFKNKPYNYSNRGKQSENTARKFTGYEIKVSLGDRLKEYFQPVITRNDTIVSNPFKEDIRDQKASEESQMKLTTINFDVTFEWILKDRIIDKVSNFSDYSELTTALNSTKNSDNTYSFVLDFNIFVTTISKTI